MNWNIFTEPFPEESTDLPDTISKLEGQVNKAVDKIVKYCDKNKCKYTDESFGASKDDTTGMKSIFKDGIVRDLPDYAGITNIEWVRPHYESEGGENIDADKYFSINCTLFHDIFELSRGNQGILGDGWLINSLCLLESRSDNIEKIFYLPEDMIDKCERYGFWICRFYNNNSIVYIIIDDYFPINSVSHTPLFASCNKPTEIWIPVIEKALAKVMGSYYSLIGHSIEDGLKLLTSNPCCTVCWKSQYNNKTIDDNVDNVFNCIDRSLGNVVLISAQIKPRFDDVIQIDRNGLELYYTYEIIDIAKVTINREDVQLILLFDLWRNTEYNGPYNINTQEFADNQEVIQNAFEEVDLINTDNLILMTMTDFYRYFTHITLLYNTNELNGCYNTVKYTPRTCGGSMYNYTYYKNKRFQLCITEPTNTIIEYNYPSNNNDDLIGLQIVTLGHNFNKRTSIIPNTIPSTDLVQPYYTNQNTICIQTELDPGVYIIIPNKLNRKRKGELEDEYYLSIYGNGISVSEDDSNNNNNKLDGYDDVETVQQTFEKLVEEENSQFLSPEEAIVKLEELKNDIHPIELETVKNFLINCGVVAITTEIEELLIKLSNKDNHYYYNDLYCLYNYILLKQMSNLVLSNSKIVDDIIYKKYNCKGKIMIDLVKQKDIESAIMNSSYSMNVEDTENIPIYFDKIKDMDEIFSNNHYKNDLLISQIKFRYAGYIKATNRNIDPSISLFTLNIKQFSNILNYYYNKESSTTSELDITIKKIKDDMNKLGIYITTIEILLFLNELRSKNCCTINDFINEDIDSQSSFSKYYSCFLYRQLKHNKVEPNSGGGGFYCSVCFAPLKNNNSKCANDSKCDNLLCNDCICGLPEPSCEDCYYNTYKNRVDLNFVNEQLLPVYDCFNDTLVKKYSIKQKYSKFIIGSIVENYFEESWTIITSRNTDENIELIEEQSNTLKLYQQIKTFPNTILQMKYNIINSNNDDYYRIIFDEIDMDHNDIINDNDIYNYLMKYNCKNITLQDVSLVMNYYTDKNNMKINDFLLLITDSRLTTINDIILELIEMSESDSKESYEMMKKRMRLKASFNEFIENKNGILSKYFNISNVIGNAIPFIFNNIDDFIFFKDNYDELFSAINEDIMSIFTDISTVISSIAPDSNDYKSGYNKLIEEYKEIFHIDIETVPFIPINLFIVLIIKLSNRGDYDSIINPFINNNKTSDKLNSLFLKYRYVLSTFGLNENNIRENNFQLLLRPSQAFPVEKRIYFELNRIYHKLNSNINENYLITIHYTPDVLQQVFYLQIKDIYTSQIFKYNINQNTEETYGLIRIYKNYDYCINSKCEPKVDKILNELIDAYILITDEHNNTILESKEMTIFYRSFYLSFLPYVNNMMINIDDNTIYMEISPKKEQSSVDYFKEIIHGKNLSSVISIKHPSKYSMEVINNSKNGMKETVKFIDIIDIISSDPLLKYELSIQYPCCDNNDSEIVTLCSNKKDIDLKAELMFSYPSFYEIYYNELRVISQKTYLFLLTNNPSIDDGHELYCYSPEIATFMRFKSTILSLPDFPDPEEKFTDFYDLWDSYLNQLVIEKPYIASIHINIFTQNSVLVGNSKIDIDTVVNNCIIKQEEWNDIISGDSVNGEICVNVMYHEINDEDDEEEEENNNKQLSPLNKMNIEDDDYVTDDIQEVREDSDNNEEENEERNEVEEEKEENKPVVEEEEKVEEEEQQDNDEVEMNNNSNIEENIKEEMTQSQKKEEEEEERKHHHHHRHHHSKHHHQQQQQQQLEEEENDSDNDNEDENNNTVNAIIQQPSVSYDELINEFKKLQTKVDKVVTAQSKKEMNVYYHNLVEKINSSFKTITGTTPLIVPSITEMKINNSEAAMDDLRMELKREHIRNAELLSKVQDVKGDILVYIRVRPEETKPGESKMVEILDQNSIGIKDIYTEQLKAFSFDRCFTEKSSQLDVFNEFEHLAISVLSGYNVSLLAYGQTGSGKTFTMIGDENNKGLYYTLSNKIFDVIDTYPEGINVNIELSMYEIYNDELRDLLVERQKTKLTIISKPSGTYIQGLQKFKIESVGDIIEYLHKGEKTRATASTDINEHSSRSHCIMTLYITQTDSSGKYITGKLNIVDLAGSEKVKKSKAVGERLVEAQNINKSLSALGDVIAALDNKTNKKNNGSNNNPHIPYRNSKLTYALKDSLSAHSKTIMIFTIRPNEGFVDETLSTLYFAQRVRCVNLGEAKKIVEYKNRDDEVIHLTNKYNSLIKEREKLLKYIDNVKDIEQDHLREKDLIIAQLNKKINNLILEQSVYDDDVSDKVKASVEQVEKYKMKNKELSTKLDEVSRKYYELNIRYKNLQGESNGSSGYSSLQRPSTLMQSASKLEMPEDDIPVQQNEQLKMKYSFSSTLPNSFTASKLQLPIVGNEDEDENDENGEYDEQLPPPPSTSHKPKKLSQSFRKTWSNQSDFESSPTYSTKSGKKAKKSTKATGDTSNKELVQPKRIKKKVHKLPPPKPLTSTISSQNKPMSAAEIRKQYDSAIRSKLKKTTKPKKKTLKSSEKIVFADLDEI